MRLPAQFCTETNLAHPEDSAMFRVTIDVRVLNYVRGNCIALTPSDRRVTVR